jgi:hypothetical protein
MKRRGFLGLIASVPAAVALTRTARPVAPSRPAPAAPAAQNGPFLIFTDKDILRNSFRIEESIETGTTCQFDTYACGMPEIGTGVTVHLSAYGLMFTGAVVETRAMWGYGETPRVTLIARSPRPKTETWSEIYDDWRSSSGGSFSVRGTD